MAKQDYTKINNWKKENTDRIQILPHKDDRLPERIENAINAGKSASRQAYIIEAVKERLEREGF